MPSTQLQVNGTHKHREGSVCCEPTRQGGDVLVGSGRLDRGSQHYDLEAFH